MANASDILKTLKAAGHRQTAVRTALIEVLVQNHRPWDVTELMAALTKRKLPVNKTTLYRELTFLQEQGIVTDIRLKERQVRYELVDDDGHHHHVVCTSCDKIEDVELDEELANEEKKIERLTNFKIQHHALEFFGLCADCR
jgi:Fur family ferric uptake transcriptional regulator